MYNSRDILTETSKARSPCPVKEYSLDAKNIPLKKDWSESWCTLTNQFDDVLKDVLQFEVCPDDVFVVTFMKCGTTWMQECVLLLMNNLDYDNAKKSGILERSPFIELRGLLPIAADPIEMARNLSSPRVIKSHMPANLLPEQLWEKKPKIIYVARNAKDVIVSSYHFIKNLGLWRGDNLHDYVDDFLNNEILYTHFWTHIVDFWKMRNESFIFFVTYEQMQQDLGAVLQRLCKFLERPQLSAEEIEKTVKHLSFGQMKENMNYSFTKMLKEIVPGVNENFQFMRRGIVGSFKDELTPELQQKIDKWTQAYLAQYDLTEEDIFGKF